MPRSHTTLQTSCFAPSRNKTVQTEGFFTRHPLLRPPARLLYHAQKQATREKIVVVSGTEEQQREALLGYMSAEALEGGRLGCPGAPAFDVDRYLEGGGGGGGGDDHVETVR